MKLLNKSQGESPTMRRKHLETIGSAAVVMTSITKLLLIYHSYVVPDNMDPTQKKQKQDNKTKEK